MNISTDFFSRLGKIELHRHLDCSFRYSTLVELALREKLIQNEDPQHVIERLLVTKPMTDLKSVLLKFKNAQKLLRNVENLERLAFETLEDAHKQGVLLLELRYSLNFIHEASQLKYDQIHNAFLRGIERAQKLYPISTGLVSIFQRGQPESQLKHILDFTIQNKDTFIGADLADSEANFDPNDFKFYFDKIHESGIPITIHCGETPDPDSSRRVKSAVLVLHAQRIGHGIQSIQSQDTISLLLKNGIHLECCPISNYLTSAYSNLDDHPFYRLYKSGLSLSVNTDDPGVFNTQITDDYQFLAQRFPLDENDFKKINLMALNASFIKESEKNKLTRILT